MNSKDKSIENIEKNIRGGAFKPSLYDRVRRKLKGAIITTVALTQFMNTALTSAQAKTFSEEQKNIAGQMITLESKESDSKKQEQLAALTQAFAYATLQRAEELSKENPALAKKQLALVQQLGATTKEEKIVQDTQTVTDTLTTADSTQNQQNAIITLSPNQYAIPNKVLLSFATITDTLSFHSDGPKGFYVGKNWLGNKETKFKKQLQQLNYDENTINRMTIILISPGNIVINQDILSDSATLKKVLFHEKMHRSLDSLSPEAKQYLKDVAKNITNRMENDSTFGRAKTDIPNGAFNYVSAIANWQELYTYAAEGVFVDNVLQTLEKEYPKANLLYNAIIRDASK